jgi:hypothetical protein
VVGHGEAEAGGDGADLAVVVGGQLVEGGGPVGFVAAVGPEPVDTAGVGRPEP